MLRNLDMRAILAAKNSHQHFRNRKMLDGFAIAGRLATTKNQSNYAAAAILPIPANIDIAESTRFSPQRSRDISANVILSHYSQGTGADLDITVNNSDDPHVESYDCGMNAISLNSVMQSNVPTPFGGMHKFSHLNMPGGGSSGQDKFLSHHLNSSHYRALRDSVREEWLEYDVNATVASTQHKGAHCLLTNWNGMKPRMFSTKANATESAGKEPANGETAAQPSKKEQLQRAFKEYGTTIIVFHVGISLVSLGCFYLLVSSGIDMVAALEHVGLSASALSNNIATGASTFVVAYAIHKIFAPVRISITLGATPFIVRYMRSKGFLKVSKK